MKTSILMTLAFFVTIALFAQVLAFTGAEENIKEYDCVKSLDECIRAEDGSLVPYNYYEDMEGME